MTSAAVSSPAGQSLVAVTGFGADLVAEPNMQVDYEIRQGPSLQSNLHNWLCYCQRTSKLSEALYYSGWGASFLVGTRRTRGAVQDHLGSSIGGHPCMVGGSPDVAETSIFHGARRPNPTFIYNSISEFEAIIAIDSEATSLKHSHGLAIKELIKEVGELARSSKAALMSVQSPVQLPNKRIAGSLVTDRHETPARSSSLAVRFTIALKEKSSSARYRLSAQFLEHCRQRGYGLWIADTRVDRRPGDWFTINELQPRTAARHREEKLSDLGDRAVRLLIPLTFVGPARIGSVYSILAMLDEYPEIGVVGCGITSFDYLVFINLIVTVSSSAPREVQETLREFLAGTTPASALDFVAGRFAQERHKFENPNRPLVAELTWDYRTYIGNCVSYTTGGDRTRGSNNGIHSPRNRTSIWFAWEGYGSEDSLGTAARTLSQALTETGLIEWSGEYLVCREVSAGYVRGKGKLSLPEAEAFGNVQRRDAANSISALCRALEEKWAACVRSTASPTPGVEELSISWRESWLGHWSS